MSDPQNNHDDQPLVDAVGIDPDMPSTDDDIDEDDDIDVADQDE
ncbi:hypothetical protein ACNPM4_02860 [Microbacterium sp. AGC62]|jgi:hypothetical protein|nr:MULTISPECIES: hypothetical protein [unclassified Microbacterium]